MKKTLSALLVVLAASAATADAQEVKTVSGINRSSENSELILPEGMKFAMRDLGTQKAYTSQSSQSGS